MGIKKSLITFLPFIPIFAYLFHEIWVKEGARGILLAILTLIYFLLAFKWVSYWSRKEVEG